MNESREELKTAGVTILMIVVSVFAVVVVALAWIVSTWPVAAWYWSK